MASTIGIDLGGTKISGVLMNENKVLKKCVRLTESQKTKEEILNNILDVIQKLETPDVKSIGLGIPGDYDKTGKITDMPHILHLVKFNLKKEVEKKTGKKITIENDANCFALAESKLGEGQKLRTVVGVIIGTGVGVGMIVDGKIMREKKIINTRIIKNKINVEDLIAGPAFLKRYSELSGKTVESVRNLSWFDKYYRKTYYEFVQNIALFFINIINTLNPEMIVVGGGLSNINFYSDVKKEIKKTIPNSTCDIRKNTLGDDSGVIGAAILATKN